MIEKKRLVIMLYSLENAGGAEKNFIKLAQNLYSKNIPTMLILGGNVNNLFEIKNFEVYKLNINPNLSNLVSLYQSILKIRNILAKFCSYEIVLVSFGPIYSFLAASAKFSFRRNTVRLITCERNSISKKKESIFVKWARCFYFESSDLITTNSKKNKDLIIAKGYRNIYLVKNYYDHKSVNSFIKAHKELNFLILSRLEPQKQVLETIKAITKSVTKERVRIDIFGTGTEENALQKLIRSYQCDKENIVDLRWHGFVHNEQIYLENFDILLHFSIYEGASNSMIEALMAGVPVLCCEHHVAEVDFLIPGENCFVSELDELENNMNEIRFWRSKLSNDCVREVTKKKLNQHPYLHELIIQDR